MRGVGLKISFSSVCGCQDNEIIETEIPWGQGHNTDFSARKWGIVQKQLLGVIGGMGCDRSHLASSRARSEL